MTSKEIQDAGRKGFVGQFKQKPLMLDKALTEFTIEEMQELLVGICKEFMWIKNGEFHLNEIADQAFSYVKQRLRDFVHDHEALTWLKIRQWDIELVDEFVYVVCVNYDYMYSKLALEETLQDRIPF